MTSLKTTMSDTKRKFQRKKIKQHQDLLNDPKYKQKIEKSYKVKKRELEDKEAKEEIRHYQND